jgi:diguanylate cyclase (GGDEF)-like protein
MLFVMITLLLLAGMFLLRLESESILLITGIWAAGWLLIRMISGGYERLKHESSSRTAKVQVKAEEQLNWIVRNGDSSRKKWSEFCRLIASTYSAESALVCIKEGRVYRVKSGYGVDPAELESLSLDDSSQLVRSIGSTKQSIDVSSIRCEETLPEMLMTRFGMTEAYPIMKSDRVDGILFVGSAGAERPLEQRASIQQLCSFAGRHIFTSVAAPTQTDESIFLDTPALGGVATDSKAHKQYFEITAKLFRIYNTDHLFDTFVSSMSRLFRSKGCFLFLPAEKSQVLRMRYSSGSATEDISNQTIEEKSSLFDLLLRRPGGYLIGQLLELTGDNFDLRHLSQSGVELVVPINLPEKRVGLLALSGREEAEPPFSQDDCEMAHTLCQTVEVILESIHQFRRIEELSYTDSMTGLYNHRYFYKRLTEEILRARRFSRYLGLAIFDIDDFKVFNDSYGHQTGDHILRQLGALFLESVRTIDIVCRYGGEEFCVIMPESDENSCRQFMERLRAEVCSHEFRSRFVDKKHKIAISAGGAIFPSDAERADRLIYCADMALLEAKKSGRNACRMFSRLGSKGKSK